MELLVKPEMLTSYIYGPTFGNAETVSALPNVGPYIYNVSISGFIRSSIYVYIYTYDISSLRVNHQLLCTDYYLFIKY